MRGYVMQHCDSEQQPEEVMKRLLPTLVLNETA